MYTNAMFNTQSLSPAMNKVHLIQVQKAEIKTAQSANGHEIYYFTAEMCNKRTVCIKTV